MRLLYAFLLATWAWGSSGTIQDPASLVLPFIGTTNGGHVFPGKTPSPSRVMSPEQSLARCDTPKWNGKGRDGHRLVGKRELKSQAGYDADPIFNAIGFSQLHDSGTGGGIPLSNFKLWPIANCTSFGRCRTSSFIRGIQRKILNDNTPDDFASPGYFSTNLSSDIRVELAAARRAALHRYTFPSSSTIPRMIVGIDDGQHSGRDQELTINSKTARVQGGATFSGSFGPGEYRAFACADFKGEGFDLGAPEEFGLWQSNSPTQGATNLKDISDGFSSEVGALFGFQQAANGSTTILARVGVSFISSEQACRNAEEDIPDFDFDRVHGENRAQWNDLLGRIQVDTTGVSEDTVKLFYSSVYRSYISPADYSGENPKWNSTEPYYDSYYCNWDTYRTLYSLMALQDPEKFARIVRAMIDIQKNEGWLPECRGATLQQLIQGGSNADPILGEFWVKYHDQAAALGVNGDDLYTALLADAENESPNWDLQGRQADAWKTLNYIPHDTIDFRGTNTRQVSRTLEYAFDDFAISQVAKIRGNAQDAAKYAKRAGNYFNVWNPNTTVPGTPSIKGMMQPRLSNGTFDFTDPRHCSIHDPTHSTCFLDSNNHDGFYEGPVDEVFAGKLFFASPSSIDLLNVSSSFIDRLDFIFEEGYFEPTDEPSQQMPYMYHYANRPGLSTQRSRQVIAQNFRTTVDGLPGNDDSGAMGSYAAFYLAGLYPLPATRQFLLSSPYFPSISFFNPLFNSTTTIKSIGFEGNPESGTGGKVFVQSVSVNGQPYKSNCYLEWDVFTSGSTVELTLTDDVGVTCGDGPDALPPSLSTGGYD
ncbi:hypothetical protein D9758_012170 [Tetrapyrgos nigripes]|uniref:Glycoside hydrolase family 92 protein n=1 Tax=Tetrapyrgos nigripes TaxID=182062 RepID=A0A8H5CGK3_9AGAR|nr:hypothetical protein D9758_012170 [Tetrapyrgos nigripes]